MSLPVGPRSWSAPDGAGVCTSYATSSHLSRVRRVNGAPHIHGVLSGEQRRLIVGLLDSGGQTIKGKTLYGKAGNARHVALDTAEYLLAHGWIELGEKRSGSVWTIVWMRWLDADGLRQHLGLPRHDARSAAREEALSAAPLDDRLALLHASLTAASTTTLARRATIVAALDRWCMAQRTGTRRQFAQAALDDTKAITASDWQWLARYVALEALGISQHTPSLWLRGPLRCIVGCDELNLGVVPDMVALTPSMIGTIERIETAPAAWLLVENRTSFEEVARALGDRYGVIWMHGFVPDWWLEAVRHLLRLAWAPAHIAADPDPAGIDIAQRAGSLWGAYWRPWAMSAGALAATGKGKPLNAYDRLRLAALTNVDLPAPLRALADALESTGRKGEQEALDLACFLDLPH